MSDSLPPPEPPRVPGPPPPSGEEPGPANPQYGQPPPSGEEPSPAPPQYGPPPHGTDPSPAPPQYGQPPPPPYYGQPPPPGTPYYAQSPGAPAQGDAPTTPYRQGPPPYGDRYGQAPQPNYPRQELMPQQITPRRSRVPLVIGVVAVLALVGGGVAAWLLLRDNGESTRAQYCTAIKKFAPSGDLTAAVASGPSALVSQVKSLAKLAPDSVAGDWRTVTDLLQATKSSGRANPQALIINGLGALSNIIADSNAHCHTTFPSLLSR
jgi:hypothetical protein